MAEAVDYFRQAIELDPSFALAYVGLADVYIWQSYALSRQEMLEKAQAAAERALELDERLGEAYNSLAGIQQEREDLEGAEATYQRALELNPNYPTAYAWYGMLLVELNRPEEALALYQRALELDPLSATTLESFGRALSYLGRFDEALVAFEKALEVEPDYAETYRSIGRYHQFRMGQHDEAFLWYAKGGALDPGDANFPAMLAQLFLDLGDPDRAEYWIKRSIELGPEAFVTNFSMQLLHLYRNDETALDFARRNADDPIDEPILMLLRDHEFRAERYAEARALHEKYHPELLNEDDPKIDDTIRRKQRAAIILALTLSKTGEQERADLLLERIQTLRPTGRAANVTSMTADAQIYALQGDKQKALSALRKVIDEGWRAGWWYLLLRDPALDSLRDEPEFQAMVEEIEADMAAQLERVREMERRGELARIPGGGAEPIDGAGVE